MGESVSRPSGGGGQSSRDSRAVSGDRFGKASSGISVGEEIPVGEFFWIGTCIGMADKAVHAHRVESTPRPGSADEDCRVRILKLEDDYAVVVLLRPTIPYGASAPHGTIFLAPIEVLRTWLEIAAMHRRWEKQVRDAMEAAERAVNRRWQEQSRHAMRTELGSVEVAEISQTCDTELGSMEA